MWKLSTHQPRRGCYSGFTLRCTNVRSTIMAETIRRVVDNRVFLLGLDAVYRKAMKRHEGDELLGCARVTAEALGVPPADGPVEGYYTETPQLTEYFRLRRALQGIKNSRAPTVDHLAQFRRLKQVCESGLFG